MFLGSPHAAQPQESQSPNFRNVWLRTDEAGVAASRTGCRMVISGRTCGDADAKSFYFFSKGSKPAATQGLPRGCESFSRRRKGTSRLFLSPPSFFFTHEKERWGAGGSQPRIARGVVPRIPTLYSIGVNQEATSPFALARRRLMGESEGERCFAGERCSPPTR